MDWKGIRNRQLERQQAEDKARARIAPTAGKVSRRERERGLLAELQGAKDELTTLRARLREVEKENAQLAHEGEVLGALYVGDAPPKDATRALVERAQRAERKLAEVEAERDRMRPVVEAAIGIAEHVASPTLHEAIDAYLAPSPPVDEARVRMAGCGVFPKPKEGE